MKTSVRTAGLDTGGRLYNYDHENRLISTTQPGMPAISYAYDGEGRRVQKTVGSASTVFVYDALRRMAAEYYTQAPSDAGLV